MPGETPFGCSRDGEPLEAESALTDPESVAAEPPAAWWDTAWERSRWPATRSAAPAGR